MRLARVNKATGDEKSKDWIQITIISGDDTTGNSDFSTKVVRLHRNDLLLMAEAVKMDNLPATINLKDSQTPS